MKKILIGLFLLVGAFLVPFVGLWALFALCGGDKQPVKVLRGEDNAEIPEDPA